MALPNINDDEGSNKKKGLPSALPEVPGSSGSSGRRGGGLPEEPKAQPKPKSTLPSFGEDTGPSIPDFDDDIPEDDDAFERMSFDEQSNEDYHDAEDANADDVDNEAEEEEEQDVPQAAPQRPQRAERSKRSTQGRESQGSTKRPSQKRPQQSSRPQQPSSKKKGKKPAPKTPREQIKERGPVYVDEENRQMKPFGTEQKGKDGKKKKKVTPSKFDKRNNLRKKQMIIRVSVISLFGILAGAGVWNALVPPDTLEEGEVMALIHQATGEMNFPSDRGAGFVENFMETFIAVDDDEIREATLNYFYTGTVSETQVTDQMVPDSDFSQQVAYGPVVYDYNVLSAESAEYIVGVAVSTSDDPAGIPTYNETTDETNVQWRFFSVNVYYDHESDAMAIVNNSPNVMPPQSVFMSEEVPEPLLPGTEEPDDELTAETRNAVQGFMAGYMDTSLEDTSAIDQYIYEDGADEPFFLTHGLDGEFELYGEEPVTHTAFYADTETPNEARALVEVSMRDTSTESADEDGASNVYNSQYMMRLVQSSDGTWYITQFRPSLYTPGDILDDEEE